jgi:hypothetical protein
MRLENSYSGLVDNYGLGNHIKRSLLLLIEWDEQRINGKDLDIHGDAPQKGFLHAYGNPSIKVPGEASPANTASRCPG